MIYAVVISPVGGVSGGFLGSFRRRLIQRLGFRLTLRIEVWNLTNAQRSITITFTEVHVIECGLVESAAIVPDG